MVTRANPEQVMVIATERPLGIGREIESISRIPHLTLFPWMTIDRSQWEEFDRRMDAILDFTDPRNMLAAHADDFGTPERPNPVRTLDGLDVDLRMDIENIAIDLNADYDPRFVGEKTTPHLSKAGDILLEEGEVFKISSMTAIVKELETNRKIVRAVYKWGWESKWYL